MMHEDILIAHITDTHIVGKGLNWMGLSSSNTDARLEAVVKHINSLSPRPNIVIHTGDISDNGDVASYLHAQELLDKLNIKYYLTCGNHDNFSNLKQVFTLHNYFLNETFACYVIENLPVRIVVLDSQVCGEDVGMICTERMKWLIEILSTSKKKTLIFLHHFPIKVKDKIFNEINLLENQEFELIISKYDNILGIFCGHSHYGASSIYGGKICWVGPSTAPVHVIKSSREPLYRDSLSHHRTSDVAYGGFAVMFTKS